MESLAVNPPFWTGKRVWVTGHTGFKGGWLCLWLKSLGADVTGFALEAATSPNLFDASHVPDGMRSVIGDIRDREMLAEAMQETQPEVVIHLAAQALVRYAYHHPIETYTTNVMGTVNLLEAVRECPSVNSVLVITSDKCYENRERDTGYCEDEAMGGYDPYSSSKGCVELVVSAYRRSFFNDGKQVAISTARAGNVIGGGDWSEDRLIPDMVRAFAAGDPVMIRNPDTVRPWQHVLDALHGYLTLLEYMHDEPQGFSSGWNFGPADRDAREVAWIVGRFATAWGDADWRVEADDEQLHEACTLKLDCSKARRELGWQPALNIEQAINWTANWYQAYHEGRDMAALCLQQLADFQRRSVN